MTASDRKSLKSGSAGHKRPDKRGSASARDAATGRFPDPASSRSVTTREAKNQLSALIREAGGGSDVTVTSDGEPAAVILSVRRYQELKRRQSTLTDFFRNSPLACTNLEIERSKDIGRETDLS